MLSGTEIESHYEYSPTFLPSFWNLSRKHFRVMLRDGKFITLNKYRNRLNEKDLQCFLHRLKPLHTYFSVLNWQFPERVGKKTKARYCGPLNGEYVVDVDNYLQPFLHKHKLDPHWPVCPECLEQSKRLTLQVCEAIEKYYSTLAIVFSGRLGFHVHVLDFNYTDWVRYKESNPIWCHHASRFKFTRLLQKQSFVFDKARFTVSVDPMRVVTVPNTLNGLTGLVCKYLGDRKDLEKLSIASLLDETRAFVKFHSYLEPLERRQTTGRPLKSTGSIPV